MKIKKSELQIIDFNLLGINIISFPKDESGDDKTRNKFDIDFDVFINTQNDKQFKIMVRLNNFKDDLSQCGYGIDVTGEFKFRFDKNSDISEEKRSQLVSRSALPMAIAHLRSIIASTTSNFYNGSYFLPSIDLSHLLQKKLKSITVNTEGDTN